MSGVLTGFALISLAIATGYGAGRSQVLGPHAGDVLSRLAFYVLIPYLMFTIFATADLQMLFSSLLPVSALAAVLTFAIHAGIVGALRRRRLGELVIGSLSAGYVNGNNIGLPVALYLLGDASLAAPIVLLQLFVFTPVLLTLLEVQRPGRSTVARTIGRSLLSPILVGSGVGLVVAVSHLPVPAVVLESFSFVGHAAVPIMLIGFGIALHGRRVLGASRYRLDIVLSSSLKLLIMPLMAWGIGCGFGLNAHDLFAVTALSALPTAQNVLNYAQRYGVATELARDTTFVTTIGSAPVLFVIALAMA